MNNSTAEQAIRKVANSLINTHRPQLGACHSVAVESSLEALAELADELSLLDIYAELTKRLEILRGGQRPPVLVGSTPSGDLAFLKLFNEFAIAKAMGANTLISGPYKQLKQLSALALSDAQTPAPDHTPPTVQG